MPMLTSSGKQVSSNGSVDNILKTFAITDVFNSFQLIFESMLKSHLDP